MQHRPTVALKCRWEGLGDLSVWGPWAREFSPLWLLLPLLYRRGNVPEIFGKVSASVECSLGHNFRKGKELNVPHILWGALYVAHLFHKQSWKTLDPVSRMSVLIIPLRKWTFKQLPVPYSKVNSSCLFFGPVNLYYSYILEMSHLLNWLLSDFPM